MSNKNNVPIYKPENMEKRIENLGYTYFSFANDALNRVVSATTLKRMAKSGYASQTSVDKMTKQSPTYSSYVLFGTNILGNKKKHPEGKEIPEDVDYILLGMASYLKTASHHMDISVKKLMKRLKQHVNGTSG